MTKPDFTRPGAQDRRPSSPGRAPRESRLGRILGVAGTVLLVGVLATVLVVARPWAVEPTTPGLRLPQLAKAPTARWTAALPEGVLTQRVLDPGRYHPVLHDRLLVDTLDSDGRLTALDASSGAIAWKTPQLYDARCEVGHPKAVACLNGDQVTLFDVESGEPAGTLAVPAPVSDLAATEGGLLVLSYDENARGPVVLHRLDWTRGETWAHEVAAPGDYVGTEGPRLEVEGDRVAVSAPGPGGTEDAHGLVVRLGDGVPVTPPGSYTFAGTGALARLKPDQATDLLDRDGQLQAVVPGTLVDLVGDAEPKNRPLIALTEQGVTRVDGFGVPEWTSDDISLPTAACGHTLLQAMDGRVTAVDLASGAKLWESVSTMSEPRLSCDGPRVVASFDSQRSTDPGDHPAAAAYDLATGRQLWQVGDLHSVFPTTVGLLDALPGRVILYR